MTCVICNSQSIHKLYFKNNYWICACSNCDHHFTEIILSADHLKLVYANDYFSNGGAGYPDYLFERDILINQGRRYARLISKHAKPGALLDVGAAAGFILKGFVDSGWSGLGIEPNPEMALYGQKKLGLKIITTSLEDFSPQGKFALITMIQVIAHFYNLRKAIQHAVTMLEPGGHVLIETWDKDSWIARHAKGNWHEYNPPSVLHYFSARNLARLMSQFGLVQLAIGRPAKWITAKHVKSVLAYNAKSSKLFWLAAGLSKTMPDRLVVPYPAADLFWALFKKPLDAENQWSAK